MNQLLRQARDGDMEAFAALFEPLRAKLFAVACRLVGPSDADDVVMEAFLKAWRALPRFGGRATLSTWLCRIVHNQAMDMLRQRQRRAGRELRGEDTEAVLTVTEDPAQPTAAAQAMRGETADIVREAVDELPDPHRSALMMRYADDLSYAEIAAASGVSIGTVMSRLFNAKRKLRQALDALTEDIGGSIKERP